MSQQQFDWYRVSLINEQKPDLQQFQKIIRSSNISSTLDRVPTFYRKKLLQLFQTISAKTKQEIKSMKSVNESLSYKKNALSDRIEHMEKGLQESKNQLVRMKSTVAEKKKMANKLRQKIDTLKKNKSHQQTYFCPFCSRNDFLSRQVFTFHMFTQHQTYKAQQNNKLSIPNNSFASSANNELKDFILTLKDKQMELMKMILSQKKEMQTQQLQKIYQREMNLMTMKNNSQPQYLTEKKYALSQGLGEEFYYGERQQQLKIDNGEGEIRGESEFLFYQKSQKYKKAAEKEEYSLRKALLEKKKQLNRHPYYDVFKDLQENKSVDIDAHKLKEQENERRRVSFTMKNQQNMQQTTGKKDTGFKFISNFNLKSNEQVLQSQRKPSVQPLRMTSNNLQSQEFHPSITDRLKEEQKKQSAAANNSIYTDFGSDKILTKGLLSQQGYVFNSGLLVDDDGGYSDWEDYFGEDNAKKQNKVKENEEHRAKRVPIAKNQEQSNDDLTLNFNISKDTHMDLPQSNPLNIPTQNSRQQDSVIIEDQQIKLNPGSYSFASRSSYSKQHISQLLSPSRQQLAHNTSQFHNDSQHQNKYSMYHNNSLNEKSSIYDLSDSFSKRDLELSKDDSSINLSDLKLSKLEKKRVEEKQNQKNNPIVTEKINSPTYGKNSQFVSQQNESNKIFAKKPLDFILVSEQKQLNFQSSNNQQRINLLHEFQRKVIQPPPPVPLIPSNYSFQKKDTYQFNDFYRQPTPYIGSNKSFTSSQNSTKNNVIPINQERALSPQQFFNQQRMKPSSFDTFNPRIPQINNQNPIVQQSFQSEKSSLPPKSGIKEYQKSSFGQNRKQSQSDQSKSSLQKESISRGSTSREKKRFRRHQDLQNMNGGILNEFFRKEYNQFDSQSQSQSNPSLAMQSNIQPSSSRQRNQSSQQQSSQQSRQPTQKKSPASQSPFLKQYNQQSSSNNNSSSSEQYGSDSGNGFDDFIK